MNRPAAYMAARAEAAVKLCSSTARMKRRPCADAGAAGTGAGAATPLAADAPLPYSTSIAPGVRSITAIRLPVTSKAIGID